MTPQEREQLIEQVRQDLEVVRTKYRSYLPVEVERAITNLCKLIVEAIRLLEEQHGRQGR